MKHTIGWVLSLMAAVPAQAGGWFDESSAPSEVTAMHAAYLDGDYTGVVTKAKDALARHSNRPEVVENVTAMLDRASEDRGFADVDPGWKLPSSITGLKFTVKRSEEVRGGTSWYSIKLSGEPVRKGVIQQLQLVRFPNEVLLDKQKDIGEYEEDDWDGLYFEIGRQQQAPLETGLYLIRIETEGEAPTEGWFIATGALVAEEAPRIFTPAVGETLHDSVPTFRFEDYKSSKYTGRERRAIYTSVYTAEDGGYHPAWEAYIGDPDLTEISTHCEYSRKKVELKQGDYRFHMVFKERWPFGPMFLSRDSAIHVPFKVRY